MQNVIIDTIDMPDWREEDIFCHETRLHREHPTAHEQAG